jgi:WD40 repeat protein
VLDLATGSEIKRFLIGLPSTPGFCDICFSPPDPLVAWITPKDSLGIANYDTGEMKSYPTEGNAWTICFSSDGQKLAFATRTNIMLFDLPASIPHRFASCDQEVFRLAFSPNGELLASAQDGGAVVLRDVATGREVARMADAHPPGALAVNFSPDGRLFATTGADATCKLWELQPGGLKLRHILRGHAGRVENVCFSPDGHRVVTTATDTALKLWDTESGLEMGTLYGHSGFVRYIWFSRDGNTIYSSGGDGDVRKWEAPAVQ